MVEINNTIYEETIEVRELPEVIAEIEKFRQKDIFIDTTAQAIRVLIRRGLIASGFLTQIDEETKRKWKTKKE